MLDLIRANMELMGLRDVKAVIKLDAPVMSTNLASFASDNEFAYYVCINTWLLVIQEYSKYGWMHVADSIRRHGLVATIGVAQDAAEELIGTGDITDTLFRSIWLEVKRINARVDVPHQYGEVGSHPLATMLAMLRYPKRLSPLGNDKIQEASIKKFLEVENRSKILQRRGYSQYLINIAYEVASSYLNWDGLCKEIEKSIYSHNCMFTSGVGFDSRSNLGSKLTTISGSLPEFFRNPFGIPYAGAFANQEVEFWGEGVTKDTVREVKVSAVPKSYKAARIIAMEDTARQAVSRAVGEIIDRYLPASVPIHDQTVNQKLARAGSLTGEVATLDLSNASDCITKVLFQQLFPRKFVDLILPLLGTHTVIDGKVRLMQQMSTAGHSLTFILESMVFNILDLTANRILEQWGVEVPTKVNIGQEEFVIPSVYGDDQVVSSVSAVLTVEVLEALGFIVNESKSYLDGSYRESCGCEYWDGIDVSSIYFPRFPLLGTIKPDSITLSDRWWRDSYRDVRVTTLSSLISLQHRLYGVSYAASRFVLELVKKSEPRMTTSFQDSVNSDLWDYDSTYQTRYAPYADTLEKVTGKYASDRYTILKRRRDGHVQGSVVHTKHGEYTCTGEESLRFYKLAEVTQYVLKKKPDEHQIRLFNTYRYQQFLQYGPSFSDPLLELLGISDAPLTLEQAFGTPKLVWVYQETPEK